MSAGKTISIVFLVLCVIQVVIIVCYRYGFTLHLQAFGKLSANSLDILSRLTLNASKKIQDDLGLTGLASNSSTSSLNESVKAKVEDLEFSLCPPTPPGLVGDIKKAENPDAARKNRTLLPGGRYYPTECQARYKVAIIIPLRGREDQLKILLSHMHPIWKRQQMDYQVYAITQAGDEIFNRAKLLNAGIKEATKDRDYDCYVLHDVDLLLEDDRCLYWCHEKNPRHLAIYMDKFGYKILKYGTSCPIVGGKGKIKGVQYFGGVSMMSKEQFNRTNGFSNLFWGWGGEDDDLYVRLKNLGYTVENPYGRQCSYHMIKHKRESSNRVNSARNLLIGRTLERMKEDGYSTVKYSVVSKELKETYTNITVDIGHPSEAMKTLMSMKRIPCSSDIPLD